MEIGKWNGKVSLWSKIGFHGKRAGFPSCIFSMEFLIFPGLQLSKSWAEVMHSLLVFTSHKIQRLWCSCRSYYCTFHFKILPWNEALESIIEGSWTPFPCGKKWARKQQVTWHITTNLRHNLNQKIRTTIWTKPGHYLNCLHSLKFHNRRTSHGNKLD